MDLERVEVLRLGSGFGGELDRDEIIRGRDGIVGAPARQKSSRHSDRTLPEIFVVPATWGSAVSRGESEPSSEITMPSGSFCRRLTGISVDWLSEVSTRHTCTPRQPASGPELQWKKRTCTSRLRGRRLLPRQGDLVTDELAGPVDIRSAERGKNGGPETAIRMMMMESTAKSSIRENPRVVVSLLAVGFMATISIPLARWNWRNAIGQTRLRQRVFHRFQVGLKLCLGLREESAIQRGGDRGRRRGAVFDALGGALVEHDHRQRQGRRELMGGRRLGLLLAFSRVS